MSGAEIEDRISHPNAYKITKIQNWIKLALWFKDPSKPNWEIWKNNWQAEATVLNDIKEMANNTAPGVGFGIGDRTQVLHKVIDPPNLTHNLNISAATLQRATLKAADLQKVEYTKSLSGQCVVV